MRPLIDHLRALADDRFGFADESPIDPAIARRAAALTTLADLLEHEPELVPAHVRRVLEGRVHEPFPGDPTPPIGPNATRIVRAHGLPGPPSIVEHLRAVEALAAAVVQDAWDLAAELGKDPDLVARLGMDLPALFDLHDWEVTAALAGHDPPADYFARRELLDEDARRVLLGA